MRLKYCEITTVAYIFLWRGFPTTVGSHVLICFAGYSLSNSFSFPQLKRNNHLAYSMFWFKSTFLERHDFDVVQQRKNTRREISVDRVPRFVILSLLDGIELKDKGMHAALFRNSGLINTSGEEVICAWGPYRYCCRAALNPPRMFLI